MLPGLDELPADDGLTPEAAAILTVWSAGSGGAAEAPLLRMLPELVGLRGTLRGDASPAGPASDDLLEFTSSAAPNPTPAPAAKSMAAVALFLLFIRLSMSSEETMVCVPISEVWVCLDGGLTSPLAAPRCLDVALSETGANEI